jgi:hypothetical protein
MLMICWVSCAGRPRAWQHKPASELIYRLEDRPPLPQTLFAAFQHLLAMFVGIMEATPEANSDMLMICWVSCAGRPRAWQINSAGKPASELIYRLEDRPPLPQTLFAAFQHLLAMFVAVSFDLNNGGHAGGEQRHADDMLGILRRETESLADYY